MSNALTDEELDELLRRQSTVHDNLVSSWDLEDIDSALREGILSSPGPTAHQVIRSPIGRLHLHGGPSRRRLAVVALVAVALVCAFSGLAVVGRSPDNAAYAAEAVASADLSPRLLIDDPAWKVTYVLFDASTPQVGTMRFAAGDQSAEVDWYPIGQLPGYVADRRAETTVVGRVQMFGHSAEVLAPKRGSCCEVLTAVNDQLMVDFGAPRSVIGKLGKVSVRSWLDALPASVFTGNRRNLAIDDMLSGLPKPPGYSPAALKARAIDSDRYQLGFAAATSVGCAWFARWFDARDRHDRAVANEASRALRGSHSWPLLVQMQPQGGFSQIFWIFADATKDGTIRGESLDTPLTRHRVANSLGCTNVT